MRGCMAEDELLDLAHGRRALADLPALEAHLADCAACSSLLALLTSAAVAPRDDLTGTTLGPYRVDGRIGAGAMGDVPARTGDLAVTHCSGRTRLLAKPPGATSETELGVGDVSLVTDIAADGRAIVFVELGDVDTANGMYARPTDGGPAVRLGAGSPLDLADDGRGVLGWLTTGTPTLAVFPQAGQPRPLAFPALGPGGRVLWARWCADEGIVVAGAIAGRSPQLWRRERTGAMTALTPPGALGPELSAPCAVAPDGRALAIVRDGRLLVVELARAGAARAVAGTFADQAVCGWSAASDAIFVRTKAAPIRIHRVDVATGASTLVRELRPPPLGLRAVYAVVVAADGDAYAYSHGQELSRLYRMTTAELT